jgi:P27 family predicted phage terminase small subunit
MGRRGPTRTPTALRILRGNPSRRPLPTNEPHPAALAADVAPPAWLDDAARDEWRRLAPLLANNGLLTVLDADALAMYCRAFASWREATHRLATEGVVINAPSGYPMASPWLAIARREEATLYRLMREFGLTPASRTNVMATPPPRSPNPLDKFMRRRR